GSRPYNVLEAKALMLGMEFWMIDNIIMPYNVYRTLLSHAKIDVMLWLDGFIFFTQELFENLLFFDIKYSLTKNSNILIIILIALNGGKNILLWAELTLLFAFNRIVS
ncbi:hypothetical protein ACJX0J_018104, partial [Zea mays]